MIFTHPNEQLFQSADMVTLIDPTVPNWYEVLVDAHRGGDKSTMDILIVDIPVDSSDDAAMQEWRDRVAVAVAVTAAV